MEQTLQERSVHYVQEDPKETRELQGTNVKR